MDQNTCIAAHRKEKGLGDDTVTRIVPASWQCFTDSQDPKDLEFATFPKNSRAAQFMLDINDRTDHRWRTYSGRGMYGAETVGVDVDCSEQPDAETVRRATSVDLRSDTMGRGRILYA
jgi:hypothetical protein